jgi:hypothetical protein
MRVILFIGMLAAGCAGLRRPPKRGECHIFIRIDPGTVRATGAKFYPRLGGMVSDVIMALSLNVVAPHREEKAIICSSFMGNTMRVVGKAAEYGRRAPGAQATAGSSVRHLLRRQPSRDLLRRSAYLLTFEPFLVLFFGRYRCLWSLAEIRLHK